MTDEELQRLNWFWESQEKEHNFCAYNKKCRCGEEYAGHDYTNCDTWRAAVRMRFREKCAKHGVIL